MSLRGCYITGTDTGVGKTLASVTLLHALRAQGRRAVGMKPLASGCVRTTDGWRNDDALALQAASDPRPAYDDINPWALPRPLAPEFAARQAGVEVTLAAILSAHARLAAQAGSAASKGVAARTSRLAIKSCFMNFGASECRVEWVEK